MIYCHQSILRNLDWLSPLSHNNDVGSASLDVHMGNEFLMEHKAGGGMTVKIQLPDDGYCNLQPGELVLGVLKERIQLSDTQCGLLLLRSTSARCGLNHLNAGFLDPGYQGHPTLELKNEMRHTGIRLYPGMPFGQIVFMNLDYRTRKPYNGRYQGAKEIEGPKPWA